MPHESVRTQLLGLLKKPNGSQMCHIKSNKSKKSMVVEIANEEERLEQLTNGHLQESRPKGLNPSITLYNVSKEISDEMVLIIF